VLGQLGNRVQHALHAFTPREQKAVRAVAETMRANPGLSIEQVLGELGVGEALVSLLDEQGRPGITERAFVIPPGSRVGALTPDERAKLIAASPLAGHYEQAVDRESAYERLKARVEASAPGTAPSTTPGRAPGTSRSGTPPPPQQGRQGELGSLASDILFGRRGPRGGRQSEGLVEALAKSAARSVGSQTGRALIRGVLGSLLGGSRR
jgi:hypothetical protein